MALGTEDFRSLVPTGDSSKKTTVRDATVLRVEGGTAWVAIDGGAAETPARIDMDAKPGDRVRVQITDHTAVVAGNSTAPATDDSLAEEAQYMAAEAVSEAVRAASEAERAIAAADEAAAVAQATDQHFFADGSGIHVTENENDASTGHNILINSLGLLLRKAVNNLVSITQSAIAFYDGLGNSASNIVAQFGSSGATIGMTGAAHQEMDYRTWRMVDRNNGTYAYVSDLRDASGLATVVETFNTTTYPYTFSLYLYPSSVVSVKLGESTREHEVSGWSADLANAKVTIPSSSYDSGYNFGDILTITYKAGSSAAKAYTFGLRDDNGSVGVMSFATGRDTVASGAVSRADGYNTSAEGRYSHAYGSSSKAAGWASQASGYQTEAWGRCSSAFGEGTIAASRDQLVIGRYNEAPLVKGYGAEVFDSPFVIGIGTGAETGQRKNGLELLPDGTLMIAGNFYTGDTGNRDVYANGLRASGAPHLIANANSATQYRLSITVAGNIRVDKSTDSGQSWTTDFFAIKAPADSVYNVSGWNGAGFVTSSSKNVVFSVPCANAKSDGSVTVQQFGNLVVRQSGYTHGSSASAGVSPSSVAAVCGDGFVRLTCVMSETTNATNNAPCGVSLGGTWKIRAS